MSRTRVDRHRERRKPRPGHGLPLQDREAPARPVDGVFRPGFGEDATCFGLLLLAEKTSLRELSVAQIVQSIESREESNDGT
ncbi:MAG: hypothetical protein OXH11_14570, partial [Candidatus Aminicenantes bacterium]|nr:hypothetical protein [Candidatus Aminicenantes bacterium]